MWPFTFGFLDLEVAEEGTSREATPWPPTPGCRCARCTCSLVRYLGIKLLLLQMQTGCQEAIFCRRSSLTNCHYAAGSNRSKQGTDESLLSGATLLFTKEGKKIQDADGKMTKKRLFSLCSREEWRWIRRVCRLCLCMFMFMNYLCYKFYPSL